MLRTRNRAGRFHKFGRIEYLPQALQNKPDEFNEPDLVGGWRPVANIWFNIKPITGREQFYGHQIVADATHMIECRWLPGITAAMRLTFSDPYGVDPQVGKPGKTRNFNFDWVHDLEERHVELNIECHEDV